MPVPPWAIQSALTGPGDDPGPSPMAADGSEWSTGSKWFLGLVDPGEFSILVPQNPQKPIQKWFFLRFCLYLLSTVFASLLKRDRDPLSYHMGGDQSL